MSILLRRLASMSFCVLLAGIAAQVHAQTVSVSATSVNFGNQATGTSATKTVRVTNTGTASITIQSVSTPGAPFSQSNNCTVLATRNAFCTITAGFAPTVTSSSSGSIVITDNATGSPQTIKLSGAGVPPVTLSPASLSFGNVAVGSTATKTITLHSNLNTTLSITSIAASGEFTVLSAIPSTLLAGGQLAVTVGFAPTQTGAASGTLTAVDTASNSPQTATLTGTGIQPVTFSSSSLSLGNAGVGTSAAKTVTLQNNLNTALSISSITAGGEFSILSPIPIPSTLAAGKQLAISVGFTPTQLDAQTGTLIVVDSAGTSPQTVNLTGTGTNSSLTSITVSPQGASVAVGGTQQFTAMGAFPSGINLDVTTRATWKSSATKIATISNVSGSQGLAKGVAAGASTISAMLNMISGSATLTVTSGGQITPTITWPTPAAIIYGTPLSATQLDATANVPGAFAYTPGAGTVLTAGSHGLSTTFTPTDTVHYTAANASVTLLVNKATPSITWSTPSAIAYGTALSGTQLNATASIAGSFVYSPAAGAVLSAGSQKLSVTFTPTDATDYTTANASVTLIVNQAVPVITWATPAAITYGTVLSGTQLNATASVPGSFVYSPAAGTVLGAGNHQLSATFTPTDTTDYTTANASVMLLVNKATPSLTWSTPSAITYGTALSGTQLNATASVGGSFVYSPAVGTVLGAGSQKLSATYTPTDATNYRTANASVTLIVNTIAASVTPNAASKTYGTIDPAFTSTLTGFLPADNVSATYSRTAGETVADSPYTISATLSPTAVLGNYTITYNTATFTINLATAKVTANPASKTYGTADPALSATETGFTTADASTIALGAARAPGETVATYTITPAATGAAAANYNITRQNANFTITQSTPVFSNFTASQSITYGTSSIALSGTLAAGAVSPPNTESVSITINGSIVQAALGSTGTFSTNFLTSTIPAATPYTITYSYAGDANFSSASDSSTTLTVNGAAATLQSITVTPAKSSIATGITQQFTATGNYSDTSTQDLTASATWSSSAPAVATISITGLATAVALGQTTVSATYGGISGKASLGVSGTGNFVPGGNMNVSRDPFTATQLDDGTVLIAGGFDGSTGNATASAEVSDPLGQTFTLLNNALTTPRAYHTATLLNNGKVLIAGGVDNTGTPTATAELYDPATKTFTATGSLTTARYLHTATLLQDGRVLFVGGIDSTNTPIATVEVYDPATKQFGYANPLAYAHYGHTATLFNDGTVFIAGGGTATPTYAPSPTNTAEIYHADYLYSSLFGNSMTTSRAFHTATLLNDGTVLLAGGVAGSRGYPNPVNSAEIYNPSSQSFIPVGIMTTSRAYHTATLLTNGMVLVAGGAVDDQGNFPPGPIGNATGAADLYDPASAAFTVTGGLAIPRSQHTATLLTNGSVLIAGGSVDSSGTTTSTTELYQPASLVPVGLTFITINPVNLTTVFLGHSQLFTATSNSGQQFASVIWSSSDPTVAVISNDASNSGTANFLATGPVTIQACAGPICGSESFTVIVPALVSLAVNPVNPVVGPVGAGEQFTATGTYSDNTTRYVTASATWTSTATGVATISNVAGSQGLATSVGLGNSTIQASVGAISNSTTLTVADAGFVNGANLDVIAHTATQLNNGMVLIVGGHNSVFPYNQPVNPQLYDPAGGSFTPTGAMNTPRTAATATFLNNGTVLIAGGTDLNGNLAATAEVYDPGTGTFSNTGNLNVPRYSHTATLLNDGTVLIAGGNLAAYGSTTNIAEIYDPAVGTFTQLASTMTVVRRQHMATLLNNGTVLILGGQDASFNNLNSAEVYDPVAQTFTAVGNMTDGRSYPTATLLNGGTVLVAGGASNTAQLTSAEIYNPATGTFTSTGIMPNAHYFHTATLLNNGTVLIAGGCCGTNNTAELYDPISGTFRSTGNLNTTRYYSTATRLNGGDVLIVGGWTAGATNAELYHPSTLTPPNLASIAVNPPNKMIAAGGALRFIATGTFQNGSAQQLASVTWSSSNTAIAQIGNDATDSGVAYGVSAGAPTITACAGAVCGSTASAVSTLVSISITPANPTILLGTTQQFTATGTFSGGVVKDLTAEVRWTGSPAGMATISPSGLASSVALSTTITASLAGASSSTILTVVVPPPSTISISPANTLIDIGNTVSFKATGNNADGSSDDLTLFVTWSSSNTSIAPITSPGGVATGLVRGATTVTATLLSAGGVSGSTTLNVWGFGFGPSAGTLSQMRWGHTATQLPNGKVLIVGGQIDGFIDSTTSAELYDPATDTFAPTGSMVAAPREYHTATLLPNGKVLIVGGYDFYANGPQSSAELYDPATGTFSQTGSMAVGRFSHTATLLPNGKVLVAGSGNYDFAGAGFDSSAELYDPVSGTFSLTGNMTYPRGNHTATLLNNSQVLIAGGDGGFFGFLATALLYDPATAVFTPTAGNMQSAHAAHTATLLDNGKVLIAGGLNGITGAELYDPTAGTFSLTGGMNQGRYSHTATLLNDGQVLVTGGYGSSSSILASGELYDQASGLWSPAGNMASRRVYHTAALLDNGQVLVAGGFGSSSSAELFLPDSQTLSSLTAITVTPATPVSSIVAGVTTLRFIATDQNGNQLAAAHWTASDLTGTNVAQISNDASNSGIAIGVSAGMATISACAGTICGSTTLRVIAFTSINVTLATPSVSAGYTDQFTATGALSDGTTQDLTASATWNSSNTTWATITATGLATGLAVGTPTITANYAGVTSSPVTLTVTSALLVSIALSSATTAVVAGSTDQFTATGTFSDGSVNSVTSAVTWSSSTAVAIINASGLATGVSSGVTTISASSGGLSNSASLTVYPTPVSIAITPTAGSVDVSGTLQFTATGTDSDSTVNDVTSFVTWTSSNTGAATITSGPSGGLASGVSSGTSAISASLGTLSSNNVTLSVIGFGAGGGGGSGSGSLNIPRRAQSGVLLPDGRLLIAGGLDDNGGNVMLSELYDPATGIFSLSGSLNYGRYSHTATLLPNGKVLVAGGYYYIPGQGIHYPASEELYDPATGTFSATGSPVTTRSGHTATLLPNGKVLIAGGWDDSPAVQGSDTTASAELYDPTTGTFSRTGSMANSRGFHIASLLPDGKVLIVGGQSAVGFPQTISILASSELYDPATGTFSTTGSMTDARLMATATLLNTGEVLVAGGEGTGVPSFYLGSAELYDPAAGTFSPTGSMLTARKDHTATLLNNGQVLLAGGGNGSGLASSVELYDPAAGSFTSAGGLMTPRGQHSATLLTNGNVLAAGGNGATGALASTELYVPNTLTPPSLISISVTPANPSIPAGQSQSLIATGTFSGGSRQQLASVTWSSSNSVIAIDGNDGSAFGVAFGVAIGTSTIQACAGIVCGSTQLTVTAAAACSCTKTGNYVTPAQAVDPAANSPKGKYNLTATINNTNQTTEVAVKLASTGAVILDTGLLPITTNWGFSPDEDRFVFHYLTGNGTPAQLDNVYVYDLTASPARLVVQLSVSTQVDRLQFSPSGRYFVYTDLQGTAFTQVQIFKVQGVTAQTLVHQDAFAFGTGSGADNFGAVSWGFSPDSPETSFVYPFVTGQGTIQWNVFNFTTQHPLSFTLTAPAAFWQYDPCGGIIALVEQPSLATQEVQISLYNTSTGLALAGSGATIPSLFVTLETTASGQEVMYSGNTQLLSSVTCPQ